MPTHRVRRRSHPDARRRRKQPADDYDDGPRYAYRSPRSSIGWVIAVAIIGMGIFWLARSSPRNQSPPAADQAAAVGTSAAEAGRPAAVGKPTGTERKENAAIRQLELMRSSYAQLSAYEDEARMLIRFPVGRQIQEERAQLRLQFQRPDKIRLEIQKEAHRVNMAYDGQHWRAHIVDPTTNNFDNQFVLSANDQPPSVAAIYQTAEYVSVERPNEMLNALMSLPAPLLVSQVAFLLDPDSVTQMIESSSDIRSLSEQSIQGRPCERIRVTTEGGSFVFWIDHSDHLLRRIQFPTGDRQPGTPTSHLGKSMLQCDYGRIRTAGSFPPGTFEIQQPAQAQVVRNFVLPPPANVDSMVNQKVEDFWFTDLRGERTLSAYWEDKVGVFVWWDNDQTSRLLLEQLNQVAETFAADRRVAMLAVSVIPSTQMSHLQVQRIAEQWDLGLAVVRDLEAFGRHKFRIEQAPAIVMLSENGTVQLQEPGDEEITAAHLTTVINKLLDGENLAEQYLDFLKQRDAQYARLLATAGVASPTITPDAGMVGIEPASPPSRLRLTQRWRNDQIPRPGNILMIRGGLRDEVLVNSGLDQFVRLSSYGSVQDTVQPPGPDELFMTTIRTAVDRGGQRYFLTLAHQGEAIHVFDDRWQHQLTYPQDNLGDKIQDAQLADLDDDGELELYVALGGARGVHRVNWQGRREWTNQTVAPVLSLTVSPDNSGRSFLLVTNDRGKIEPLDAEGERQQSVTVPSWSIHHLVAAPTDQSPAAGFCGVAQMPDGSLVAVGLSALMTELWSQPVSRGTYGSPVDFIQPAEWGPRGNLYWIVAAPTGKIHIMSADGQFHDEFTSGSQLYGLAGYRSNGSNLLLASTEAGVTAWEVELPEK